MLKIGVSGASGRMGRAIINAVSKRSDMTLSGALVRPDSEYVGLDAGQHAGVDSTGVMLGTDPTALVTAADVLIDVSMPEPALQLADLCASHDRPLVIGTTGFNLEQQRMLESRADRIPLVLAPNLSAGVAVAMRLIEIAACSLGEDFDVDIHEIHHRYKRDKPSGTALRMGKVVEAARKAGSGNKDRENTGTGRSESIGYSVVRGGDVVGEHTVIFSGMGERLEITHRAFDRAFLRWGHCGRLSG